MDIVCHRLSNPRAARLGAACALALTAAASSSADVLSLSPVRDNTLYEFADGGVPSSNALGPTVFVGKTNQNLRRRALLAFNVSAIPAGSTITAVTLTVFVERGGPGTPTSVTLKRMTADWGQGTSLAPATGGLGVDATPNDPTWLHSFFSATNWTTPGGDFAAAASGTTAFGVGGEVYTWASEPGLVADVQAWLANPSANFGWIMIGDETNLGTAYRVRSVEGATRPMLNITFTPPALCGTADFDGDGDVGTDADIEAFFACLAGNCCALCFPGGADFNADGDVGTDADIEAFFRVLAGGNC